MQAAQLNYDAADKELSNAKGELASLESELAHKDGSVEKPPPKVSKTEVAVSPMTDISPGEGNVDHNVTPVAGANGTQARKSGE